LKGQRNSHIFLKKTFCFWFKASIPWKIVFGKGYPWIKPTDVVRMLHTMKRLDLLLPEDSLQASASSLSVFWRRFREQYPSSTIFEDLNDEQLQWSIPCKIHGDEGRSNLAASELRQFLNELLFVECE